jgi:hypothetical protein
MQLLHALGSNPPKGVHKPCRLASISLRLIPIPIQRPPHPPSSHNLTRLTTTKATLTDPTIMQLLPMYLALFLGTILATSEASRDHEDLIDPRPSFRELGYYSEDFVELTCNMLETFDSLGRNENRLPEGGLVWDHLCDEFDPLDEYLCPTEGFVEAICSANKPFENPAVKKNWCIPVFGAIEDTVRRNDCIKFCTIYVSAARGDCCGIGPIGSVCGEDRL